MYVVFAMEGHGFFIVYFDSFGYREAVSIVVLNEGL